MQIPLDDREGLAIAIVEEVMRQRLEGVQISDAEVLSRHADLRSELTEALRVAEMIGKAQPREEGSRRRATSGTGNTILCQSRTQELAPGRVLVDRYRIVRLAGEGGMGQVYRAEDLKLGQTVALKFLPDSLHDDPRFVTRFHAEVRIARSLSHPNICRVYDLIEIHGRRCMTMEFIEGEDLAQLLDRQGHLQGDEAEQIAKQLCSGLLEAHQSGVIHRDLKPSNIMIDGRGNVRITDFGLAVDQHRPGDAVGTAGTIEYMAPEVLRGEAATVQSDLYALGIVIYELFAGRSTLDRQSMVLHNLLRPRNFVEHIELPASWPPFVREIIEVCTAAEPVARPSSVEDVVSRLPGGENIRERRRWDLPPPELVAASQVVRPLSTQVAIMLFLSIVAGLTASMWTGDRFRIFDSVGLTHRPRELDAIATQLMASLELPLDGQHHLGLFIYTDEKLQTLMESAPRSMMYWYRQAPRPISLAWMGIGRGAAMSARPNSPPMIHPGETELFLRPDGKLLKFERVPGDGSSPVAETAIPILFAAAGLDPSSFAEQDAGHQSVRIWRPIYPAWDVRGIECRIVDGTVQRFIVDLDLGTPTARDANPTLSGGVEQAMSVVLAIGAGLMARRNLRRGYADRLGAVRIAFTMLLCNLASSIILTSYQQSAYENIRATRAFLANATYWSLVMWALYLAIEPLIRKAWPEHLISWSRLLRGQFRDPIVGRDILIGMAFAAVSMPVLSLINYCVRSYFGMPSRTGTPSDELYLLQGLVLLVPVFTHAIVNAVYTGFVLLMMPVLAQRVLRSRWIAVISSWLFVANLLYIRFGRESIWMAVYMGIWSAIFHLPGVCFGLLAGIATIFTIHISFFLPHTPDFHQWYWSVSATGTGILMGVAALALWASWPKQRRRRAPVHRTHLSLESK